MNQELKIKNQGKKIRQLADIIRNSLFMIPSKGFTLIELLVVIAIIGVLVSFIVANFIGVKQRARDGQRKSDLRQIQAALEIYRADQGSYPSSLASGTSIQSPDGKTIYMQDVPWDPLDAKLGTGTYRFQYCFYNSNAQYALRACLENTNDSQRDQPSDPSISGCTFNLGVNCSAGGAVSYTLQNP